MSYAALATNIGLELQHQAYTFITMEALWLVTEKMSFALTTTQFVPGGNIPRVETKKRECWKFLDWRLNSENDSRVHGQPSFPSGG